MDKQQIDRLKEQYEKKYPERRNNTTIDNFIADQNFDEDEDLSELKQELAKLSTIENELGFDDAPKGLKEMILEKKSEKDEENKNNI